MPINIAVPDYDLLEVLEVTTPGQLRAMSDQLRGTILDLLLERAATVSELATAIGRPKSTVAHHVNVLVAAGMLKVVRTRRVRAIDERFYGRTARLFQAGEINWSTEAPGVSNNLLTIAGGEAALAHRADELRCSLRHARIPHERAHEFWEHVVGLLQEFVQIPRSGDTTYGFAVGLYPTDHPTLPDKDDDGRSASPDPLLNPLSDH